MAKRKTPDPKAAVSAIPAERADPYPWLRGPRPCTDVENKAALQIIQAVLAKQMTVAEAEEHLHTIFRGRELP